MSSSRVRSGATAKAVVASMKLIAIGALVLCALLLSFANLLESFGVDPWAWARPERRYRVKSN